MAFGICLYAIVEADNEIREYLGISYIKAYLVSKGMDCEAAVISRNEIERVLSSYHEFPKLIGISLYCDNQHLVKYFCNRIKETNSNCHIVLGGPQVLDYEHDILTRIPDADSVCTGEGEESIYELATRLKNGVSLVNCKGITYRNNDKIIVNPQRPYIENLNQLPLPFRERNIKNKKRYFYIMGSRGCLGRCTFCAEYKTGGSNVRIRDPVDIVDEIEGLLKKYGINKFHFTDPTFEDPGKAGEERAKTIFKEIIRRGLKVRLILYTRTNIVNQMSDEYYDLAYNAGVESYFIGVEAGNIQDLKLYQKKITLDDNQKAVKKIMSHNIYASYGFIFFNPYSTYESLQENIDFLYNSGLIYNSQHIFSKLEIMPQAPIKRKLMNDNLLDEFHFDSNLFSYRYKNPEIKELYDLLIKHVNVKNQISYDTQIAIDCIQFIKNNLVFYNEKLKVVFDEIDVVWKLRNKYLYEFFNTSLQMHRDYGANESLLNYIKNNRIYDYDSKLKKMFYKYTKISINDPRGINIWKNNMKMEE